MIYYLAKPILCWPIINKKTLLKLFPTYDIRVTDKLIGTLKQIELVLENANCAFA